MTRRPRTGRRSGRHLLAALEREEASDRRAAAGPASKIVALLGPTNTGKTHRALERMMLHESAIIGLPLRLLAREVYDRLSRTLGEEQLALVTGEEKRVGAKARYWVCTVEAMPQDLEVDFLCVDEIQLAQHAERGHVFTDRLLHSRGRVETWFLGAETMRRIVQRLVPTASFERLSRLSSLSCTGQSRLGQLRPRTALVAFSIGDLYALAERVMHRRGGAAVVLGALSPRARNAQVALYEAGEVDYLVATDAIGMGLNLSIRHVAFASFSKFDGQEHRDLTPAEVAQIAGRAGRHHQPGTFGTLAPLRAPSPQLAEAVRMHQFHPVPRVWWRTRELDFSTAGALVRSLATQPPRGELRLVERSRDAAILARVLERPEVRTRLAGPQEVRLLWELCQIPDYGRTLPELRSRLVEALFLMLTGRSGRIGADWMEAQLEPLSSVDGNLEHLLSRLATIRTWKYVSFQVRWLRAAIRFQGRTQQLEDDLSDALHRHLLDRFVAKRKAQRRYSGPFSVLESLKPTHLEEHPPGSTASVQAILEASHERFRCDEEGRLHVDGLAVGRLRRGASIVTPEMQVTLDNVGTAERNRLLRRIQAWSRDCVGDVLGAVRTLAREETTSATRGLLYQLEQSLGTVPVRQVAPHLGQLDRAARQRLNRSGLRFGRHAVYFEPGLQQAARRLRLALCKAHVEGSELTLPSWRELRGASFQASRTLGESWLNRLGFVRVGPLAIRADVVEEAERRLQQALGRAPAPNVGASVGDPVALAPLLHCSESVAHEVAERLRRGAPRRGKVRHRPTQRRKRASRKKSEPVSTRGN